MEQGNKIVTIPNTLSVSRIAFMPVLIFMAAMDWRFPFLITYTIIGTTDYFDGKIAKKFKMQSELGKTLDSVADLVFYLGSLGFIYFMFPNVVQSIAELLIFFFAIFFSSFIISWIFIGKPILMHTQLLRVAAVFVYLVVILCFFSEAAAIYAASFTVIWYFFAFGEEILIFLFFGEVDRDTRWLGELIKKKIDARKKLRMKAN